jgi:hypothetical protein
MQVIIVNVPNAAALSMITTRQQGNTSTDT